MEEKGERKGVYDLFRVLQYQDGGNYPSFLAKAAAPKRAVGRSLAKAGKNTRGEKSLVHHQQLSERSDYRRNNYEHQISISRLI